MKNLFFFYPAFRLNDVSKINLILIFIAFFISYSVTGTFAYTLVDIEIQQQSAVTGRIVDDRGMPLPGVSIVLKGTTHGVVSDFDGNFRITDLPSDAVLVFSFVGLQTQEIEVAGRQSLEVTLHEVAIGIDEVVVIGYGKDSRRNISSAISSASSKDLDGRNITSFDQALDGKIPGVNITQSIGGPGAGITFSIRGVNSLTGGNQPLYVVDGIPITGSMSGSYMQGNDPYNATYYTNPLNSINPNDIESIQVLKDAAASAIYGSRGSNGVVIITTKQGKVNQKATIDFRTHFGVSKLAKKVEVMDAYEFANYMKLARDLSWVSKDPVNHSASDPMSVRGFDDVVPSYMNPYLEGKPGLTNTDWQDEVYRTAISSGVGLSISGGTDLTTYFISLDYTNQEGIMRNSGIERITNSINLESQIMDKIKVGINLKPTYIKNNLSNSERNWGNEGAVIATLMSHPNFPAYNPDGSYNVDAQYKIMWSGESNIAQVQNPVALAEMVKNEMDEYRLLGNMFFEVDILKNLIFKSMAGIDYNQTQREYYRPKNLSERREEAPTVFYNVGTERRGLIFNQLWENTLNYYLQANKHQFNVLVGQSVQKEMNSYLYGIGRNFTSDNAITLGNALDKQTDSDKREWSMLSYFSRINYNYLDKYLLAVSMRADGSSRFGLNNKWGYFPSVSGAWRVSDESFMTDIKAVDELKYRISYGLTGNNDIPFYGSQALLGTGYYVFGNSLQTGLYPSSAPNANLTWETTKTFNTGIDLSILKGKFRFIADYFISNTEDLLLNVPVPASSGYTTSLQNIGKVRNQGIELRVDYAQKWGNFAWNSSINYTRTRNKIIELGPNQNQIISNGGLTNSHISRIGHPIGSFFGYNIVGKFETQEQLNTIPKLAGAKQAVGDFIYEDTNGDKVVNEEDRVILGDNYPDYIIGFNNEFTYKNFDLSIGLIAKQGMSVINTMHRYTAEAWGNNLKVYLSDEAPRPVWGVGSQSHTRASSWQIEDASFIRIRNINIGYNLPSSLLKNLDPVKSLRVYVTLTDPITWTNYSGYNPEVSSNFGNALTPGEEFGNYPVSKNFTFGINLKF